MVGLGAGAGVDGVTVAAGVRVPDPLVASPEVAPSAHDASRHRRTAAPAMGRRAGRPAAGARDSVVGMSGDVTVRDPRVLGEAEDRPGRVARRPVVLDVDTGVDDACALLLASLHPALDLKAVTCVGGNAPLADVVRNTLTVLDAAGRGDVPVAAGADRPLLEEPVDARHVHGEDGMGDLDWPRSTRTRTAARRGAAPRRAAGRRGRGRGSPSCRWRR